MTDVVGLCVTRLIPRKGSKHVDCECDAVPCQADIDSPESESKKLDLLTHR